MRTMRSRFLLLLVATLLPACESPPPNLRPEDGPGTANHAPKETTLEDLKPFLTNRETDYPLYPGDVVRITVQGHEDLTIERKIPSDGKIPIPGARPATDPNPGSPVDVKAAGKRIPELEGEIRELYAANITNPYVTVRVVTYAPKKIYVAGAVANPRDYQIPDEERISLVQALTMAGWFTESAARDRVRVIRPDRKTGERVYLPPIDVGKIVSDGEVQMDILLEPGDTVTVDSKASQSVYIFGYVEDPGEVAYSTGLSLTRLITRVGGLKEYAKITNIRILRNTSGPEPKVFYVDLKKVFAGEAPDFPLAPGDVIYVDETFF